jgi:hypothetical protein
MVGSLVRRLSILAAGAALVVAAGAAPVVVDAAGLMPMSTASAQMTPVLASRADLQVSSDGVRIDGDGGTVYRFTIKNVGQGAAHGVKVTKLSQIKENVRPHQVKNTITVVVYDEIPAGQTQSVTVVCERSARFTCTYSSVDVAVDGAEINADDNFAAQSL